MDNELISKVIGKNISELNPTELAAIKSQLSEVLGAVDTKFNEIKTEVEKGVFAEIAGAVLPAAKKLGWARLPEGFIVKRITVDKKNDAGEILKDTEGNNITEDVYVTSFMTKAKGQRKSKKDGQGVTRGDVNGGDITMNKIFIAKGGMAKLVKLDDGTEFDSVKSIVKALKNTETGAPESDRCYEISQKGISGSDIITRYHPKEVGIVFQDGTEATVEDAVQDMAEARKASAAQTTATEAA